MRLISGGEMLIVYAAIFGGLMVLLRYQPMSLPLYVIGAFALPALVLYSVVTPNLGTLHRMRYGFLMLIVGTCIGLVARHFLTRRHSKCKAV